MGRQISWKIHYKPLCMLSLSNLYHKSDMNNQPWMRDWHSFSWLRLECSVNIWLTYSSTLIKQRGSNKSGFSCKKSSMIVDWTSLFIKELNPCFQKLVSGELYTSVFMCSTECWLDLWMNGKFFNIRSCGYIFGRVWLNVLNQFMIVLLFFLFEHTCAHA